MIKNVICVSVILILMMSGCVTNPTDETAQLPMTEENSDDNKVQSNDNELEALNKLIEEQKDIITQLSRELNTAQKALIGLEEDNINILNDKDNLLAEKEMYEKRYESHQAYILNHQLSNAESVDNPLFKGLGFGSNYANVIKAVGLPENIDHIYETDSNDTECWIYTDFELQFDNMTLSAIKVYGEALKELSFVVDEAPLETMNFCKQNYDHIEYAEIDELYEDDYDLGDGSIIRLSIDNYDSDANGDDRFIESSLSHVWLLSPQRSGQREIAYDEGKMDETKSMLEIYTGLKRLNEQVDELESQLMGAESYNEYLDELLYDYHVGKILNPATVSVGDVIDGLTVKEFEYGVGYFEATYECQIPFTGYIYWSDMYDSPVISHDFEKGEPAISLSIEFDYDFEYSDDTFFVYSIGSFFTVIDDDLKELIGNDIYYDIKKGSVCYLEATLSELASWLKFECESVEYAIVESVESITLLEGMTPEDLWQ